MTEDQIKQMAERFLGWKLPADFHPDAGVVFTPVANAGTQHEYRHEPTGTNLFSYTQAVEMVRHMVGRDLDWFAGDEDCDGNPLTTIPTAALQEAVEAIVRDVAELPDRTSPDDWPEAMLVTADELTAIVRAALSELAAGDADLIGGE